MHWGHQVRDRFPAGQLYVDLRGHDPGDPMPADEALAILLNALGADTGSCLPSLDARSALLRTVLAERRAFLLLDNAASAQQVRPLLPGTAGCFVVITSRNSLAGLVAGHSAHRIELDPLPPVQAEALLTKLLGSRVAAEPDAATTLADRCDRLPLALRLMAEIAAARPDTTLAELVDEFTDERRRLDMLDATADERTAVRSVLSWSYQRLPADIAAAFRLLGLHPVSTFSLRAAAALFGTEPERARLLLDRLCQAHLVSRSSSNRFGMHDLIRIYARERTAADLPEPQLSTASRRILDYYLHAAYGANRVLEPRRHPIDPPPGYSDVSAEPDPLSWFTEEHPALRAAVGLAAGAGYDDHAWRLAWTLTTFFERKGHWHDWISTQQVALAAARRLGDRCAQAHTHRGLARVDSLLGHHDDAYAHLLEALRLYAEAGDDGGQARTHLNLSSVVERLGRHDEALRHDEQALERFVADGDRFGQALALNQLGCDYMLFGDCHQALASCEQALALVRELGDEAAEAATLDSLATAHRGLGQHTEAVACYRQAIAQYQLLGNQYYEADTLVNLGDAHDIAGDADAARDAWKRAVDLFTELSNDRVGEVRTRLQRVDGTAIESASVSSP